MFLASTTRCYGDFTLFPDIGKCLRRGFICGNWLESRYDCMVATDYKGGIAEPRDTNSYVSILSLAAGCVLCYLIRELFQLHYN